MTFYCPKCWTTVGQSQRICPSCGTDLTNESKRPYVDRLIDALRHPLPENRMIAIQVLGNLKAEGAVPALEAVVNGPSDYYEARESLSALAKIGTAGARQGIEHAATRHPSRMVRRYAASVLRRMSTASS